jgi:hypothetical protein
MTKKTSPVAEAKKTQEQHDRKIQNRPFQALEEIQQGIESIIGDLSKSIERTNKILGC